MMHISMKDESMLHVSMMHVSMMHVSMILISMMHVSLMHVISSPHVLPSDNSNTCNFRISVPGECP